MKLLGINLLGALLLAFIVAANVLISYVPGPMSIVFFVALILVVGWWLGTVILFAFYPELLAHFADTPIRVHDRPQ